MRQAFKLICSIFLLVYCFQLFAQTKKHLQTDTSVYSSKRVTISGKRYTGIITPKGFQLLSFEKKVYLKHPGDYFTWEFKDFNKDGYKDIYLDKGGNTPGRFDLLIYVPTTKSFEQVKNFEAFPAPEKIKGTKYYYSYHRSGCADMNWDSDLFYIKEYKVLRIGNISGRECENSGIKDGIYINKCRDEKKRLIKTFPIDTAHKFKEDKWGFIKEYWAKNYKSFL